MKKGFSAEQIIGKLREAEVLLSQRSTVGEVSCKLGVTEQTYCWQRREYLKAQLLPSYAESHACVP
jgi:hypothetical protein